jgi:hypothetical protein
MGTNVWKESATSIIRAEMKNEAAGSYEKSVPTYKTSFKPQKLTPMKTSDPKTN